ncbi:phasin family protein [Massilia sp. S19_KUP03_FR1]|uniref:phasin family protein n=1 Tax=Massilia sp. S19_KUP03_FR1 TaxID=3025503 RepID=UPI002FCDBF19
MTFPDKLSDAGKEQLAKQIDYFQAFSARAFENAERILALNLQTTRAALDHTAGAVRQLADVRDPRDLMVLTSQTQTQVEAAMAYSRKLFEIANQPAVAPAAAPAPAPEEHIVTAAPVMVSEPVAEAAPAPIAATLDEPAEPAAAPSASAILPSTHPLGEADPEPAPAIAARARPIARAASKVAAAPVEAPHPAASPMPEAGPIAMPAIAPVDAVAAPLEAAAAPQPKRAGGSAAKGSRKR